MKIFLILILSFFTLYLFAQSAPWVSYPSANQTSYGVYHFRKSFDLEKAPEKLVIHVLDDNRNNLLVRNSYYINLLVLLFNLKNVNSLLKIN